MNLRTLIKGKRKPQYKYNLNTWLWKLPTSESYNSKVKHLAWLCSVSPKTFQRWRYIKEDESAEIPHSACVKICQFMSGINPEWNLKNFQVNRDLGENKIIKK